MTKASTAAITDDLIVVRPASQMSQSRTGTEQNAYKDDCVTSEKRNLEALESSLSFVETRVSVSNL
jgi:hypothetical protein